MDRPSINDAVNARPAGPAAASTVRLRPHHLMCVHGFKGKGYSPEYVKNFWKVVERLKEADVRVEVVAGEDAICSPCPNNNEGTCTDEPKIQKLDRAYEKTLQVKGGEVLVWDSVKARIAEKVSFEEFESNCEPCSWRALGYCREALGKLKDAAKSGLLALALVASLLFTLPHPAEAQDVKLTTTVDMLEQNLLLDKSRRITIFRKVLDTLARKDYRGALEHLKVLEKNVAFADYYHYLSGQAEAGRMKKAAGERKYANAALAGEQALYHFTQVTGSSPFSALAKRVSMMQGETELALGNAYASIKNRAKAVQNFEKGFERLSQINLMAVVPKSAIVTYALICEKQKSAVCVGWVGKLSTLVAKTEDAKIIERIVVLKKPAIERTTQIPYKIDLDLEAFNKAYALYQKGKFEEAYTGWRDLLKSYPRTTIKLRTKFWMGRAAQRSNHLVQAETLYREVIKELPFSYYALLSSWHGGIDVLRMMDAELPQASADADLLLPTDVAHVRRAETFISSGVPELAQIELADVRQTVGMPNEFLVYLAALNHLAGNHLSVFQVLGELSSRSFQGFYSSYGQKLYFPSSRMPLIREMAKESKVDPLIAVSVIKQESAFNEEAVSVAHAYGLMQLIAPTARDLEPSVEVSDLFKPATNVKLGTRYIHQLLNRYKGNIIPALAAYNAGPGNSDRWLREAPQSLPPEEFIEFITFRETREYVQNILRNYFWYNHRILGDDFKNLPAMLQAISATANNGVRMPAFARPTKKTVKPARYKRSLRR